MAAQREGQQRVGRAAEFQAASYAAPANRTDELLAALLTEMRADRQDRYAQPQRRTERRGSTRKGVALTLATVLALGAVGGGLYGAYKWGENNGNNGNQTTTTEDGPGNGGEATYTSFRPSESWNWDVLNELPTPTYDQTLQAHRLTRDDIRTEDLPAPTSWEPALTVVELTEEKVDNTRIPLLPGYQYTVALEDGSIKVFWGGDPNVAEVDVKWGFSARWVPEYQRSEAGQWLNVEDPTELMVRENRFGRYLRNIEQDQNRIDVPYFDRVGPYYTDNGNLDLGGWVPPSLDATIAKDYRDAATMFGGIADASMWKHGEAAGDGFLNWSWTSKNATEEWQKDAKWQSVYVPSNINGYVEIWLSNGTTGPDGNPVTQDGPYKFYAGNETDQILQDGRHNVEEFSVHIDRNR